EQLRKRSEELAARQKSHNEKVQEFEAQSAGIAARKAEVERQYQDAQANLETARQEHAAQVEALQARQDVQARREKHHREQFEQMQKLGKDIAGERKALADERAATRQEQEAWLETQSRNQAA